jgi:hypothetical protein
MLGPSAAILVGSVLITGFLIASLHLGAYGIVTVDLIRARYLYTGSVFYLYTGTLALTALAVYRRWYQPQSPTYGEVVAGVLNNKRLPRMIRLNNYMSSLAWLFYGSLLPVCPMLALRLFFSGVARPGLPPSPLGLRLGLPVLFWGMCVVVFLYVERVFGFTLSRIRQKDFTEGSSFIGLLARMWAHNVLRLSPTWLGSMLLGWTCIWYLFGGSIRLDSPLVLLAWARMWAGSFFVLLCVVALGKPAQKDRADTSPWVALLRSRLFAPVVVVVAALFIVLYSSLVYPYLPQEVGGGLPQPIVVQSNDPTTQATLDSFDGLWFLDETGRCLILLASSDGLFEVLQLPHNSVAVLTKGPTQPWTELWVHQKP